MSIQNNIFSTILRVQGLTFIIAKRPAKKGLFDYIPMSDVEEIDKLLKSRVDPEKYKGVLRLFSGFCPKAEAYSYARAVTDEVAALVRKLEEMSVLKPEPAKIPETTKAEYRLKDGYTIRLESNRGFWLVEEENGQEISRSRMLSLREGISQIRTTVSRIEEMEGVSFQIIKR